jgi:DNA-binding LytR/AlgR family response regulator
MLLNTIIVDDSLEARKILEFFCNKNKHISLIAKCDGAQKGLEVLDKENVDLVFLDMKMPLLSGIDFLNRAPDIPMVIFTTSEEKYAVDAFEYNVQDFLKKPFNYPTFERSIKRAIEKLEKERQFNEPLSISPSKSIFIKEKGRYIRLNIADILYFENASDYVHVHCRAKHYTIYSTLKSIASKLTEYNFLRIHRSFIINLNEIVDIEENTLVIERKVIPIAKAHKSTLMRLLKLL